MKLDMRLGDCLDVLPTLEAGSVQTCITSPPYWGLRDYGVEGQLGLEATPEEYVAKMVEVFREVRRVLRDDGTLWLNLGDSYFTNPPGRPGNCDSISSHASETGFRDNRPALRRSGLKPKDLVGIPWSVAFALRADGWYLRSDIIWHKSNPMPESCTDRPTKSHDYLFLLTKSARYFYDADAIREGMTGHWQPEFRKRSINMKGTGDPVLGRHRSGAEIIDCHGNTRNKRSVWTIPEDEWAQFLEWKARQVQQKPDVWQIPTQAYPKAHFATFPEALVLPCILAGTSEEGCCAGCGAPYVRVTEREQLKRQRPNDRTNRHEQGDGVNSCGNTVAGVDVKTIGWQPTCTCGQALADKVATVCMKGEGKLHPTPIPCTVLDPFLGSGTTAKVSQQYGRSFVGCELSAEYLELARDRFRQSRLFA